MIKLTATALIHYISPVIDIPSRTGGNSFQKRELILNDSYVDRDNQTHPNFVLIEFSGESMSALDNFQPGQRVTVDAYVNGREHNGRYFNTLRGRSIRPYQQPQAAPMGYPQAPGYPQQAPQPYGAPAPAPAPASAPAPAPAPAYPQQMAPPPGFGQAPAYPQQPAYPQTPSPQMAQPSQQYNQQQGNLGVDQLPFTPQ